MESRRTRGVDNGDTLPVSPERPANESSRGGRHVKGGEFGSTSRGQSEGWPEALWVAQASHHLVARLSWESKGERGRDIFDESQGHGKREGENESTYSYSRRHVDDLWKSTSVAVPKYIIRSSWTDTRVRRREAKAVVRPSQTENKYPRV